jgi:cell division protein FtsA
MRRIYTSIDIGSNAIKMVVGEMYKGKLVILASTSIKSKGIRKGLIVDVNDAIDSIKKALTDVEGKLGLKITKVVASIPSYTVKYEEVDGYSTITNEDKKVTGNDLTRVLQGCVYNKVNSDEELVTIMPIQFFVDNKAGIRDPKGLVGNKLGVRAMMVTTSKKNVYAIVSISGILLLVNLGNKGVSLLPAEFVEHNEKRISGAVLIAVGIISFFLH